MARSRQSTIRSTCVLAALAIAATLSGCSATNPISSQLHYDASDGVSTTLGDISAQNLLLVAAAADEPGALQGALSNTGDQAVVVELSTSDGSTTVRVPAGQTVLLGGAEGEQVLLITPDAPGATTDLTVATASAGQDTLPVPVLDGTLSEYADLVPDATATAQS